ncbi:unnamed protein product [Paramecium octaurelia]|uniref:Uncharacterized protein n=1 Tax=Paramecium octaurelia TaxID=43137 RepID=A0A8S1XMF7_PAROT|nr:unnamed protein product [Paramecium octaurelia]
MMDIIIYKLIEKIAAKWSLQVNFNLEVIKIEREQCDQYIHQHNKISNHRMQLSRHQNIRKFYFKSLKSLEQLPKTLKIMLQAQSIYKTLNINSDLRKRYISLNNEESYLYI